MKEFIDPFLYNLPHLDLHGYDSLGGVAILKNFIDNNLRIDNKKLIVVHGKGTGILKKAVHDYLKRDKRVIEFKTNNYNDGETIIYLR